MCRNAAVQRWTRPDLLASKAAEPWSLTSLREKLIKIGAEVVNHGRYSSADWLYLKLGRFPGTGQGWHPGGRGGYPLYHHRQTCVTQDCQDLRRDALRSVSRMSAR